MEPIVPELSPETVSETVSEVVSSEGISEVVSSASPSPTPEKPAGDGRTVFRIQVKSAQARIPLTQANFGDYADVMLELRIDGRYKYFCGNCFSYQEGLILQRRIRRSFPDAFMVAFRDGHPVPLAEVIGR